MKNWIYQFILAFAGSVTPAVLFNVRYNKVIIAGLIGAAGWLSYLLVFSIKDNPVLASFVAATIVGILSEIFASIYRVPSIVFSVAGLVPLVPGYGAYYCAKLFVENNINLAIPKVIEMFEIAGAIAAGVMISDTIKRNFIIRKKGKRKIF